MRQVSNSVSRPNLPTSGETAAIAVLAPKTAALCFDRVWGESESSEIPDTIAFFACTETEVKIVAAVSLFRQLRQDYLEGKLAWDDLMDFRPDSVRSWTGSDDLGQAFNETFCRLVSSEIESAFATTVIPVYSSRESRDLEYQPGSFEAVIPSLEGLGIVDETTITWEQVFSFREDIEAQDKYRRLIHWLDKEMIGKSQAFIEDEIAIRLKDYYSAIRKHGIKTIAGLLSSLVAPPIIAAFFAGGSYLAPLLAGVSLTAGVVVRLVRASVNIEDTKRSYQEIAFVHEVIEKVKDKV